HGREPFPAGADARPGRDGRPRRFALHRRHAEPNLRDDCVRSVFELGGAGDRRDVQRLRTPRAGRDVGAELRALGATVQGLGSQPRAAGLERPEGPVRERPARHLLCDGDESEDEDPGAVGLLRSRLPVRHGEGRARSSEHHARAAQEHPHGVLRSRAHDVRASRVDEEVRRDHQGVHRRECELDRKSTAATGVKAMGTLFRRSIRSWPASLVAIASLGVACDAMAEQQPGTDESVTAVLKMRESDFVYRSQLYNMSCDELRNGVAVILRAVGARDDVQVRVSNCNYGGAPEMVLGGGTQSQTPGSTWDNNWDRSTRQQSPMDRMRSETPTINIPVHIWAMMPVPADSKVMKEMEKDKARRELISKVTGNMNAAMNDPILFAAKRQQVTL